MKKTVRIGILAGAVLGIGVLIGIVVYRGVDLVTGALLTAGWGLLWIAAFHAVPLLFSALGWQAALSGSWRGSSWLFIRARFVREAINNLLPVAQVGGDFIAARLLTAHGVRLSVAMAGALVDLTVEVLTQFVFTAMGLAALLLRDDYRGSADWLYVILGVAVPALGAFVLVQRSGVFTFFERILEKMAARWQWVPGAQLGAIDAALDKLYRNKTGLGLAAASHLMSWIAGAGEIWLALRLMGHPIGVVDALLLESLGNAVRSAGFAVPGALGVQEVGYMLLGELVGLTPEMGLALSLAKRVREMMLGIPGLLVWQAMEGRRLWRRARRAPDASRGKS